jgi:hypothetical protein
MEREKSKEFDLRAACLTLAPEAVEELAEIMREGGRNSQARLGAIQQILDRAFGRPSAQIEVFHGGGLEIIVSGPKSGPALPAPAAGQIEAAGIEAVPADERPALPAAGEAAAGIEASARVLAADAEASGAQAGGALADQPGISAAGSQGGPAPAAEEVGRRAAPVPRGTGTSLSPGGDGPSPKEGSGLDGYRSFEGEDE